MKYLLRTGKADTLTTFGYEPDWSPVGDKILLLDRMITSRYLITVSATTSDTSLIRGGGIVDGAVWSPAGDEIVAHASEGMVAVAYPSGDLTSIPCTDPDQSTCAGVTPCWSPDGDWLAFRDGARLLRLPRTGGAATILIEGPHDLIAPRWSPDGRWVVFAMQDSGSTDWHLWAGDLLGQSQGLRRITASDTTCHSQPCSDYDPCWSPDGTQIYFSSTRGGQKAIWRIDFKP